MAVSLVCQESSWGWPLSVQYHSSKLSSVSTGPVCRVLCAIAHFMTALDFLSQLISYPSQAGLFKQIWTVGGES